MGERIYHLSLLSDWEAALASDQRDYRMSTIGRTLADEGFIHFSRAGDQLAGVAERYYSGVTDPLCLLEIDTALLPALIVDEPPAPGSPERYPHLYVPLPVDAVVSVTPVHRDGAGQLTGLP